MIELGVVLQFFLVQPHGDLFDDASLEVDDFLNQCKHGLRNDVQDVADVRHELGRVMLRDRHEIGTVRLIDPHQRKIQSGGQLQKSGPQATDQRRIVLNGRLHVARERVDNEPRVTQIAHDLQRDEEVLPDAARSHHVVQLAPSFHQELLHLQLRVQLMELCPKTCSSSVHSIDSVK